MTYDQIVTLALQRCSEFGETAGLERAFLLRRIGRRQSQWFQRSARMNSDFYGVCIVGILQDNALDLAPIAPPESPIGRIERIEIADPGTSDWDVLTEVTVVPLNDPRSGLPPRVTLREFVLRGLVGDLDGVTKLRIYYTKQARSVGPSDGALEAEIREPYVDILVLDVAQYILKTLRARGRADVVAPLALLAAEEAELTQDYDSHMTGIVLDVADRFRRFGTP